MQLPLRTCLQMMDIHHIKALFTTGFMGLTCDPSSAITCQKLLGTNAQFAWENSCTLVLIAITSIMPMASLGFSLWKLKWNQGTLARWLDVVDISWQRTCTAPTWSATKQARANDQHPASSVVEPSPSLNHSTNIWCRHTMMSHQKRLPNLSLSMPNAQSVWASSATMK